MSILLHKKNGEELVVYTGAPAGHARDRGTIVLREPANGGRCLKMSF